MHIMYDSRRLSRGAKIAIIQKCLRELTAPQPGRLRIMQQPFNKGIVAFVMFGEPNRRNNPMPDSLMNEDPAVVSSVGGLFLGLNPINDHLVEPVSRRMDALTNYWIHQGRDMFSPLAPYAYDWEASKWTTCFFDALENEFICKTVNHELVSQPPRYKQLQRNKCVASSLELPGRSYPA